ncbi:MAG: DUF1501 domain-containing protein, partial [Rubripirellula sp.]
MHKKSFYPCGQTRRQFVWQMGHGVAGLALADLLGRDGFFGTTALAADDDPSLNPLAPKEPVLKPRAKACIFLTMNGAPSQVDTFDYKPELEKYAGQPLPQDRKYINSGGRKVGFLTPAWRKFRPGGKSGLL